MPRQTDEEFFAGRRTPRRPAMPAAPAVVPVVSPHAEHHYHANEYVGPESPHKESWLRYVIGIPVGLLLVWAMLSWGGMQMPLGLLTFIFIVLAPIFTFIVVPVQVGKYLVAKGRVARLRRKGEMAEADEVEKSDKERREKAGWLLPLLATAVTVYGWIALLIWIGQTYWGWTVT
jgi:hypothetical protein